MGLKQNTWSLDQWYGQIVAGNVSYSGQGALYTWGDNEVGGLGNSSKTNLSSPIQILGTTWPKDGNLFSAGYKGCTAIKTDGTLWAWGYNGYGQLGQNNTTEYSSPKQVPGTTWATVTAGQEYTMATKTDGTLWAWGRNNQGQLGSTDTGNYYSSPIKIPGTDWKTDVQLGSQANAAMAVKTDGTLWAWGEGNVGSLAQNNRTDYSSPRQIPGTTWSHCVKTMKWGAGAIKTDGTLWVWGDGASGETGLNQTATQYSSPIQIPGTGWVGATTVDDSVVAIRNI